MRAIRKTSVPTRWPADNEVRLSQGLGKGEKERAEQRADYKVTFGDGAGGSWVEALRSADDFARYPPGSRHRARVHQDGRWELLGPAAAPDAGAPAASASAR